MQKKKQEFDSGNGAIYRTNPLLSKLRENYYQNDLQECPRCGEIMIQIQSCHYFCENCGGHLDCSDI